MISRDRSGSFAEGATQGAPDALQVADRWHLLHNLGDAVEEYLKRQHRQLPQATPPLPEPPTAPSAPPKPERRRRTDLSKGERGPLESRARRLPRFEAILELCQRGMSMHAIERQYGISRDTVSRWVKAGSFPERAPRVKRPSRLDRFRPYLEQRWAEGCRNGRILLVELQAQGFRGGHTLVTTAIAELRRRVPRPEATPPAVPVVAPVVVPAAPAAPRTVRWWFVRSPSDLTTDDHRSLVEFFSKRRKGGRLSEVEIRATIGEPGDLASAVPLERLNGTLRDRLSCLTWKTPAFAKDVDNGDALLSLALLEHTWIRPHIALLIGR